MGNFEREALDRLARIEAALAIRCDQHGREIKEIKEANEDHEDRIRPLESQHNKLIGIAAGSGIAASVLIKISAWIWGGGVR